MAGGRAGPSRKPLYLNIEGQNMWVNPSNYRLPHAGPGNARPYKYPTFGPGSLPMLPGPMDRHISLLITRKGH